MSDSQKGHALEQAAVAARLRIRQDVDKCSPRLASALIYISKRFLDTDLRINTLAKECQTSRFWLATLFRRELGISPWAYVTERRLETARQLLDLGGHTVAEVARQVGYGTETAFRTSFTQWAGEEPRAQAAKGEERPSPQDQLAAWRAGLRQALVGDPAPARAQEYYDAIRLACTTGSSPESLASLLREAPTARREARVFDLLWPLFVTWPREKQLALARDGYRFETAVLIRELLRSARERIDTDPRQGLRLAKLAAAMVDELKRSFEPAEITGLRTEARTLVNDLLGPSDDPASAEEKEPATRAR